MRHFVLFKFEDGFFDQDVYRMVSEVMQELCTQLPDDVLSAKAYSNIVDRPGNYDLMLELTLAGEASLDRYLSHPVHQALIRSLAPHRRSRISFDC